MQFSVNKKLTGETDIILWSLVTSELAQLDIYGCRNKLVKSFLLTHYYHLKTTTEI